MKLKFTLEDIWDLEDDIACIADYPADTGTGDIEEGFTEEKDGVIFTVFKPRFVFPRLGVACYQAEMFSSEDYEPLGNAVLMYKQDERDLNKYEACAKGGEIYDIICNNFTSSEEDYEECIIDLDEFLTKEQLTKLKSKKPDLTVWNYLVE